MNRKAIAAAAVLSAILPAQPPTSSVLQELTTHHQEQLAKTSADPEAYQAAVKAYEAALRKHLQAKAKGREKCETRFNLVSLLMFSGRHDAAKTALDEFDVAKASSVDCAIAAVMAQDLRLQDKKTQWIAAALRKPSTFEERMELGTVLMTALYEIDKAEALFDAALEAAKDKESKARVTWHIAKATREREDLPEGSYEKALRQLAKDFAGTRFGDIAADRIQAMDFKIGADALPVRVKTTAGPMFDLAKHRGRPVLLSFLAADVPDTTQAARNLQALHEKHSEAGLAVVGIWLDTNGAQAKAAIRKLALSFPQSIPKGGWDSDLALRLRVESAPQCLLIGRDGKIAGMNFLLSNQSGQQRLAASIGKALATDK